MAERYDGGLTALETELRELGRVLVLPPAPDVRAAVRARVAGAPPPRRGTSRRARLAIVVAAVLATLATFAATPAGQAAATHLLRLMGIEFRQTPAPIPHGSGLMPGETPVSLEAARRRASFPLVIPDALGRPDAVTVSDGGRVVSLIYWPGPGRPAAAVAPGAGGEVALRLDEFDGSVDPVFGKFLAGSDVEPVSVAGHRGAWVNGPHEVVYIGRDGQFRTQSARLSARTLIWQTGAVTLRLEGNLSREQALAIARTAP